MPETPTASLVVTGARVWTGDPGRPWAEAAAVSGEEILAVGTVGDAEPLIGNGTEVIESDGGMLVPGFIDTHVHFLTGGAAIASVQLRDAQTPEAFAGRIEKFAETVEPGEWILGGAWDHTLRRGKLPRRDWIDAVTPDNPLWIFRLDGHMALANSLSLKQAGVDADTPDVAGGVKGFMDGSLGSHTATMLEPFTDTPDKSGFLLESLDNLRAMMMGADAVGLQLNIHAIGDKAIRDLLDILHDVARKNGDRERRLRMEHAQHIHPDDIDRFAVQGVIASMQPYHAIDDGRWAEDVIGAERAQTTYAFKSLIDRDLTAIPPETIRDAKVLNTIRAVKWSTRENQVVNRRRPHGVNRGVTFPPDIRPTNRDC